MNIIISLWYNHSKIKKGKIKNKKRAANSKSVSAEVVVEEETWP